MNLSRDQLRRRRRREYFGPWLPSPVLTDGDEQLDHPISTADSPGVRYDLMESVTLAFLLALEALTPVESRMQRLHFIVAPSKLTALTPAS